MACCGPPTPTPNDPPADGVVFDLLEFTYELIAEAQAPSFHSYMGHTHYSYDRDAGRALFAQDANLLFERNGMAFELTNGEVIRTAPAVLHEALAATIFKTGDAALDQLLE